MQIDWANVTHIQVAVITKINQDLIIYWPKCRKVSWGVGPNKSRAMNKHKKCISNPYFAAQFESVIFGDIIQHKGIFGIAVI